MRIALVAAVAANGVIGAHGGLAWRVSDDLKWFKRVTDGKPIIMGRKTFDSIGMTLPGRDNLVITRSASWSAADAIRAANIDDAISIAKLCAEKRGLDEICVIGGGDIYAQTIDRADRLYLTRVDAAPDGDAFFPQLDSSAWREKPMGGCAKGPRNDHSCEFFILDRKQPPE